MPKSYAKLITRQRDMGFGVSELFDKVVVLSFMLRARGGNRNCVALRSMVQQ